MDTLSNQKLLDPCHSREGGNLQGIQFKIPAFAGMTIVLLFLFCSILHAEVVDKVVATVNRQPITQYEVNQAKGTFLRQIKEEGKNTVSPSSSELEAFALTRLIDEALLNQQIEKSKIEVSESELTQAIDSIKKRNNMSDEALRKDLASKGLTPEEYKSDIRKQMKRLRFFSQTIGQNVKVSEDEVAALSQQSGMQASNSQKVHIAQIVYPYSSPADAEDAYKKASNTYDKVKNGKGFEKVMQDTSAQGSGDLGELSYSGLSPELSLAVAKLGKGQVSEPVKTTSAYVIVKLIDKSEGSLQASEEVKAALRDKVYEYKMQEEVRKYIEKLKKDAFIQIKS